MNNEILSMILVSASVLSFAGLLGYWSYQMAVEARNEKKLAIK
ncbi:MAG: hypothetical protein ACKVOU_03165 [Cytophagales bacterium]